MIQDLEVGTQLREHLQSIGIPFTSNVPELDLPLDTQLRQFLDGKGPLSKATASDALFYYQTKVEPEQDYPDLEVSFTQGNDSNWAIGQFSNWKTEVSQAMGGVSATTSFTFHITPVHTYSVGTVRLNSSDPFEYPLVDPNILSDSRDVETMLEGVKICLKVIDTPAMKAINATLAMKPLSYCKDKVYLSDDYWRCLIPYITNHNNHPVATNKMGPNPSKGDVVDNKLKVHGIKGLRVADNGVVPIPPTSHPNAIAYLIAERGSALIKEEYFV